MKKTIAIDHGNRMVKTVNSSFVSGYIESGHLVSMGADTVVYKDKEYILSENRIGQVNDKTTDESFFILTLFAIGKEILLETNNTQPVKTVKIELLVGLPPLHIRAMRSKFEDYFQNRGKIVFEFNGMPISFEISNVEVFPQAYAAAMTINDKLQDIDVVNIVDIGGYTVDCLQLMNLQPGEVRTSIYKGVNMLMQRINSQVRATGANDLRESAIESIIGNENTDSKWTEIIQNQAQQFALEIVSGVRETGLDLIEYKTIFMGGGSILLKDYILKTKKIASPIFIDDIHANAKGYKLIYDNLKAMPKE